MFENHKKYPQLVHKSLEVGKDVQEVKGGYVVTKSDGQRVFWRNDEVL